MDTGEVEKGVEQNSASTAEWSAKEIDEVEEASELKPPGLDTTSEAFEPGGVAAESTPTLGSKAQDEFLLEAKPSTQTPGEPGGTRP